MKKIFALTLFHLCLALPVQADDFIAGTRPDQRPAQAPVIQQYAKPPAWYTQALHGLTPPYPASFHFLEAQGAWYTPFTRPGMTGPYDIRGWHQGGAQ